LAFGAGAWLLFNFFFSAGAGNNSFAGAIVGAGAGAALL
jgi:hypothetical protein